MGDVTKKRQKVWLMVLGVGLVTLAGVYLWRMGGSSLHGVGWGELLTSGEIEGEYDWKQQPVTLVIEAVQEKGGKVKGRVISPVTKGEVRMQVVVECEERDYRIFAAGEPEPRRVRQEVFMREAERGEYVSGWCGDEQCTRLVRECTLYTGGEQGK